jgi:hypothetical protein
MPKEDFRSDYGDGGEPDDWVVDDDDVSSGEGFTTKRFKTDTNEQALVYDCYEGGICPDCENRIPKNTLEGENCEYCGHVFYKQHEDDDE